MILIKCKMCGGDIQMTHETIGICDSCGSTMTLPRIDEEKKTNLFNRANQFRLQNDFDKALQAYEYILNDDFDDAEAHWGCVLSRFGIEYVEDPITHKRVPTCHRVHNESILADADYLQALEYATDGYTRSLYESEALAISVIQKEILHTSNMESPYDIFICYKETSKTGLRTKDSTLAQTMYDQLTAAGFEVFFARITLEDKLGQKYEPYIFSALQSAKVMLVVGTDPDYINSPWVKNEWSRYLMLMESNTSKLLIPCYSDMAGYDLPVELSALQSQDMSKIGFMQDLIRGIRKVVGNTLEDNESQAGPTIHSLYQRAVIFLEDGVFPSADEYFDKVLDMDPTHAPSYIGKVCCQLQVTKESDLVKVERMLVGLPDFDRGMRFADFAYQAVLTSYFTPVAQRIEENHDYNKHDFKPGWKDIVGIAAGLDHTVGLRDDGTVLAIGNNDKGQCDVSKWIDIEAVQAVRKTTIGYK